MNNYKPNLPKVASSTMVTAFILFCFSLQFKSTSNTTEAKNSDLKLLAAASQAFVEDTNTVTYMTNDPSLLSDSLVEVYIDIDGIPKAKRYNEQVPVKISISNSDKVAYFKYNGDGTHTQPIMYKGKEVNKKGGLDKYFVGDTVYVSLKGFGRAVVTVETKANPDLKASFPIYVAETRFSNADSIYNAQIESASGTNTMDPLADVEPENWAKDAKVKQIFYIHDSTFYAAQRDVAEYSWRVKVPGDVSGARAKVNTSFDKNKDEADSVEISFSKGGRYVIELLQEPKELVIDSLPFFVNLNADYTFDVESGYFSTLKDTRDGTNYDVAYIEGISKKYLAMTGSLRYIPAVEAPVDPSFKNNPENYSRISINTSHNVKTYDAYRAKKLVEAAYKADPVDAKGQVYYSKNAILGYYEDNPGNKDHRHVVQVKGMASGVCPQGSLPWSKEFVEDAFGASPTVTKPENVTKVKIGSEFGAGVLMVMFDSHTKHQMWNGQQIETYLVSNLGIQKLLFSSKTNWTANNIGGWDYRYLVQIRCYIPLN